MTRYFIIALLAALLAAGGYAFWQTQRLHRASVENDRLTREVATLREVQSFERRARTIAQDTALKQSERERQARAALEILMGDIDNADLPLDPRLTELLECLRLADRDCSGAARDPG